MKSRCLVKHRLKSAHLRHTGKASSPVGTALTGLLEAVLGCSVTKVSKSSLIWQMLDSDLHTVKLQGEESPLALEK